MPATQSLMDWLKPRRSEAIARIRSNAFGLIALLISTLLSPLPNLWTAFRVVSTHADVGAFWWFLCATECLALGVMGVNILQASYALQYPPTQHPVMSAPTPTKSAFAPQSPQNATPRRLGLLSSTSSPQPQKAFNSSYAASPVSTPSRTLNYSIPHSNSSPFDLSLNSSTASVPSSPSPILSSPLAAYRGKHSNYVAQSFNGDLFSRMTRGNDDDDD
ncbi:hypothetical protein BXZ70DRAFT_685073 [Cristinia sonorae]|uniref:Uncharacterized protein n=1 Tax=Cristinia sonorae TaxID=1940300 RepID=A0A8K0XSX1_9AGAR|nr:hypothetical protein BXZ70DRAFT_685073 [Cristinia sonorae]